MVSIQLLAVVNAAALLTSVRAAWHQVGTEELSNTGLAPSSEGFLETQESEGTVEERPGRRDSATISRSGEDLFDWQYDNAATKRRNGPWGGIENTSRVEKPMARSQDLVAMEAVKEALAYSYEGDTEANAVTNEKKVEQLAAVESMLPRRRGGRVLALGASLLFLWLLLERVDWSPSDAAPDPDSTFGKIMEFLDTLTVILLTLSPGLIISGAGQLYISYKTRELVRGAAFDALSSSDGSNAALQKATLAAEKANVSRSLLEGIWQIALGLGLSAFTLQTWDAFAESEKASFGDAIAMFAPVGLTVHGILILAGKLWEFSKNMALSNATNSNAPPQETQDELSTQVYVVEDDKTTDWLGMAF